jgi:RNA polymerase sigma-70 factor (ECF subfamily)
MGDSDEHRLVAAAVRRAQAGDREAIGFLYARYAADVRGYICTIVRDQHEAEDITQHVFARLIHTIGKYQEQGAPFRSWVLRVARNVTLDHLRRRHAIPVERIRPASGWCPDPTQPSLTEQLREALLTLPHEQREVLVMRHFAGLSPGEIGALTRRSQAAVHGLHHRGRRTLQRELARRGVAPVTAAGAGRHAALA